MSDEQTKPNSEVQAPEGPKHVKREFGLTNLAVSNRISVLILVFIILFAGIQSYRTMPKESFPEIVFPLIYVGTPYPGNSPVDIENLVTRPIEKELKGINGVKVIKSTSIQDFSSISVEFNPEVEVEAALQDVKDAVDRAKSNLPSDLDADPNVFEIDLSELPIMFVNLSGDYSLQELKLFAEYLQDQIEALPQISKAEIRGALEREIRIDADPYKMEAMEVSFGDIQNAISAENVTLSGGNILMDGYRRSLRVVGEFEEVSQIENVIIKDQDQRIVYVRDVATVRDATEEPTSFARADKQKVITLNIVKRGGENLIEAADQIKEIIAEAQASRFPEDLSISITNDQSKFTRSQLDNLENSIISGVILVILVLMFFLGLRNALFVGIAIPLSMFISFSVLNFYGVTLNLMVLFSLILALGMLVDNGIVVVENIYRLMSEGMKPVQAARQGVGEVAWPIIASTATTLAAFLPLAFWQSTIGEFFRYLPITLIIVLSSSLFVALVINPVLTAMYMQVGRRKEPRRGRWLIVAGILAILGVLMHLAGNPAPANVAILFAILIPLNLYVLVPATYWFQDHALVWMENIYERTLKFALGGFRPAIFFLGTFVLLFVVLGAFFGNAPKVLFFPEGEPSNIYVFLQEPVGTDIEAANEFTRTVENDIIALLEPNADIVESVIGQVGDGASDPSAGPSGGGGTTTPNKALITIAFVEYQDRHGVSTNDIMEQIREEMEKYPGVQISVSKEAVGPPVGPPVNIEVSGEDYEKLITLTTDIQNFIVEANIEGLEELKSDLETGKPELIVHLDRDKAQRFGLSTYKIAGELRTALFGVEVSKFKDGEDEYPIQLRLADEYRYDVNALLDQKITFRDKFGKLKQVPISAVADVEYSSTYGSVKRKDLDRVITLSSNVRDGANANEVVAQIKELLEDYNMPEGFTIKFTGEQEEQAESAAFLANAMLIAVGLIFLIIVAQFNSFLSPFIIMFSVILSMIGVFLGLLGSGADFVIIMTGIGIISLAGVVVNNAIVLIDYTNLIRQRHREELGLEEDDRLPWNELLGSIVEAGKTRLRPVLLTAITTVLGLLPLAYGVNINFYELFNSLDAEFYMGGDNASFWGPMAWTVIYGLVFATFLTLIIVPVMYLLADRLMLAIHRMRQRVS